MFLKGVLHIVLVITLVIQLFPTNAAGRLFMFSSPQDESSDDIECRGTQLRQLAEEEKDLHIEHNWVIIPFRHLTTSVFHFSVVLPIPHPGAIPTPPPNRTS